MPLIEQELEFEFASFGEEFVPFLAKNQFKTTAEKIALIMDPS
jgi:hypothetical protein